jgi:ABC-2 type transport system ATP-binding protein
VRPILVLDRAHARDAAGPGGRPRGSLAGVSLALGPGVHAVLGSPEDGTLALADIASGLAAPTRGNVTVSGRDPARTAFLRARIGVLAPEPRLPAAPSVRDAVRLAMRARGETGDRFDAVIDPLGLGHLHGRSPRSLSFAEQRAIELALALSTPAPVLLVLHEPLADVAVARQPALHLRLREAAAAGACVLVTTSSPADARALADRIFVLQRGLLAREATGDGLAPAETTTLVAHARSHGRDLAAALAARPEVRGVRFEEHPDGSASLAIEGASANVLALALTDAAVETGAEIEAITQRAPGLAEVHAATEMLWRAARAAIAARNAAPAIASQPVPPPPPPAAPPPAPPEGAPHE